MRGSVLALLLSLTVVALRPGVSLADPTSYTPPGSSRVQFFTVALNHTYVIPATTNILYGCPFDVTETEQGWIAFRDYFDQAGNFKLEASSWHLTYTDTANGKTVTDVEARTRWLTAQNIVTNPDGTVTIVQTWTGRETNYPGFEADVGRVTFSLTIDPTTGQELSFQVLDHAGQLSGIWSSGAGALCAQLAP